MRALVLVVCVGFQLLAFSHSASGQHWTEFRGLNGVGHSSFKNIPTKWSDDSSNVKWKVELPGLGWSSPVISDGKIWLTTSDTEKNQLSVLIIDLESGKTEKSVLVFTKKNLGRIHKKNSHASPSAIIDGEFVYVHFGDHGTACLSKNGDIVWKKVLEYGHFHGPGGSPVISGNSLILSCDGGDKQFLVALNKKSGDEIWKTEKKRIHPARFSGGKMKPIAFSTPTLRKVGDRVEVVVCGADHIAGYNVADGKELWWASYDGYSVVPRPVFHKDMVFYSSSYNNPVLYGLKMGRDGEITDQIVWQTKRGAPHNPSPLVVDGLLYAVSDRGIAQCFDAETGDVLWQERLGKAYSASPIYVDGKIYFQDETGGTTVIRPGKKYDEIAKNKIDGRTLATPVPIANGLLIRTDSALLRISGE